MPLDLRCRMLSSEYYLRVSSNAYNPVCSCIFSSQFTKFFDKNPTHIHPLGLRVSGDLSDIGFTQKNNLLTSVSSTPPWHLVTPTVDLSLSTLTKSVTSPEIYHSQFLEICEGLQDLYHIYTDGSKMNNFTADVAVRPWAGMSLRAYASAAMPASLQQNWLLLTSLLILSDVPNVKKFAIFSHSLSSLLAINNRNLETGYMQKFITDYSQLSNSGKIIILIWIPSHIGIRGNEAAKSALNLSMSAVKCPATDLYSDVANHCQRLWQAEWDGLSQTNYTLLNLSSATVI